MTGKLEFIGKNKKLRVKLLLEFGEFQDLRSVINCLENKPDSVLYNAAFGNIITILSKVLKTEVTNG